MVNAVVAYKDIRRKIKLPLAYVGMKRTFFPGDPRQWTVVMISWEVTHRPKK